ncbi:hypothetical protein KY310_03810 [Candidatus Woesearchaeota archaeon]|nr:hypothetical protein [Candidatus Woesearchaeota archaeon]
MNSRIIAAVLLIKAFILLIIVLGGTMTGSAVIGDAEGYANTPADKVHKFFGVEGVMFPSYDCGEIASGLYQNIADKAADDMAGFMTQGPNRAATINFILDRIRLVGTIDMVKGNIVDDPFSDSLISINSEAVVRTPKDTRKTFFNMDLYGVTNDLFYVQRGRFATPSLDCTFVSQEGVAICDCQVHSIRDIAVAGIPNPLRVELENPPPALKNLQ